MSRIKPAVVLAIITTLMSALLIAAHNLTYTDTSEVMTKALHEKCVQLMGEGEYSVISDWTAEGFDIEKPSSVSRLIKKDDGSLAFEIIVNGYNKDGLNLLIAMNDDGSIKGVKIISMKDTPGIGTMVSDSAFLSKFVGRSEKVELTKKKPVKSSQVEVITGASYSSKGVISAINTAISVYKEMGAVK